MLTCLLASACIQIGAGASYANPQDCGIWYMCGRQYPHAIQAESQSYSAGLEGANWRAGFLYLGRFATEAKAIASENPSLIPCAPGCYPMSTWHGSGKAEGVYAEYVQHFGAFRLEAGPWIYRATWHETIPDWFGGDLLRHVPIGYHRIDVSTDKTTLGGMAGAGFDIGRYSVVASVVMASDRGCDRSIVKNLVGNVSLRISL